MQKETLQKLKSTALFAADLSPQAEELLAVCGKEVFLQKNKPLAVGPEKTCAVILSGTCVIYTSNRSRECILRFASEGETVGIASLFQQTPIATRCTVCSEKGMHAVLFSARDLTSLMDLDRTGALRDALLAMLSRKIAFLNRRIACVTGGSSLQRFSSFLCVSADAESCVTPGVTMTDLARLLDIGRASLYRAISELTESGAVALTETGFRILDFGKTEAFCAGCETIPDP